MSDKKEDHDKYSKPYLSIGSKFYFKLKVLQGRRTPNFKTYVKIDFSGSELKTKISDKAEFLEYFEM
jgi:hypothetical protein